MLLLLLNSCYYDSEEHLYGLPECGLEPKSYSNDVAPIIAANCNVTGCHDGTITSFATHANVETYLADIRQRINDGSMPPSTSDVKPTAEEVLIITCWIDEGGIDN